MRKFRNTPYLVSKDGNVFREGKAEALKPDVNPRGYRRVTLCIEGKTERFLVHRMVAETYIPNPLALPEVNHKDLIPGNDWESNLEWVTKAENQLHAIQAGKRSHLVASKAASQIKLAESVEFFKQKLGTNFIAVVNESPRNFVEFLCGHCLKKMKCRSDSSTLSNDIPVCRPCKYKMKI